MVQMIQFFHMQGDPFHILSNVLNSKIFSIVLIQLLIELLMRSSIKNFIDYIFSNMSNFNLSTEQHIFQTISYL